MVEFRVQFEETNLGFDAEFSSESDTFDAEFGNLSVVLERDHSQLVNRDIANQHPITAIIGLENELGGKLETIPAMANEDIENILKGFI